MIQLLVSKISKCLYYILQALTKANQSKIVDIEETIPDQTRNQINLEKLDKLK